MERLGLRVDGVGTTPFAGALRMDRPLSPDAAEIIQLSVMGIYGDFIERVSVARDMDPEEVDAIGGGRVWTGIDAQRLGLIDELGGLDDALDAAADLAGLEEYAVTVLQRQPTFRERMLMGFLQSKVAAPLTRAYVRSQERPLARWAAMLESSLGLVTSPADPRHAYL